MMPQERELQLAHMKLAAIRIFANQLLGPLPPVPERIDSRGAFEEFMHAAMSGVGRELAKVLDDDGTLGGLVARGTLLGPGGQPMSGPN